MTEPNSPVPIKKRPAALTPGRIRPAEAVYRSHFVLVEAGTDRATIFEPTFWAHVAAKLRPLDRLEIMDDEGSWLTMLIVRAVGRQEAVVTELWSANLSGAAAATHVSVEFEAKWRGHKYKWSAVRLSDKAVMREDMETREEAEAYIRSHLKALAA